MAGRTIAIGDIHGCSLALAALLDAIDPNPDDLLVTLGDYIDRGPDSRGVLDQVIALAWRCTLVPLVGNHEEMLLAALEGQSELDYWMKFGGMEALASYGYSGCRGIRPGRVKFSTLLATPCERPSRSREDVACCLRAEPTGAGRAT